jgi:hypothetical protein
VCYTAKRRARIPIVPDICILGIEKTIVTRYVRNRTYDDNLVIYTAISSCSITFDYLPGIPAEKQEQINSIKIDAHRAKHKAAIYAATVLQFYVSQSKCHRRSATVATAAAGCNATAN